MQLAYCGTLSFSASGWADSFTFHRFPPSTKSENCFREVLNIWSVHSSGDIYSGTPCVMTLRASAVKLFPTTLANNAAMEQHKHRCENESSDFNLLLICKITFCTRFILTGNKQRNKPVVSMAAVQRWRWAQVLVCSVGLDAKSGSSIAQQAEQ